MDEVRTLTSAAPLAAVEISTAPIAADGPTGCKSVFFALYPDDRISGWNEPAERMLGYSAEQAVGRHLAWFFPVDEVPRGESERALRLAGEHGFHH